MMDSRPVRNMYSTLSNKSEKQCISLAFIIRIYHDAGPSVKIIFLEFTFVLQDQIYDPLFRPNIVNWCEFWAQFCVISTT
jgi:hypothetical protein